MSHLIKIYCLQSQLFSSLVLKDLTKGYMVCLPSASFGCRNVPFKDNKVNSLSTRDVNR